MTAPKKEKGSSTDDLAARVARLQAELSCLQIQVQLMQHRDSCRPADGAVPTLTRTYKSSFSFLPSYNRWHTVRATHEETLHAILDHLKIEPVRTEAIDSKVICKKV